MKSIKGFCLGVILALSCLRLYTMSLDIISGVKLWQSLSPQDKAEIKYIIKTIDSPLK